MRNTGSTWKKSRYLNISLSETGVELKKRPYGPGQHGNSKKRKPSEYGKQLIEKQKLRELYGINERQFVRLFKIAQKSPEITGLAFLQMLESRLDNLVFRFGFSKTRKGARQLVNHGHVLVNGKKIDIPSFDCKIGDVITLKDKSKSLKVVKESLETAPSVNKYLDFNKEKLEGKYVRLPERNELTQDVNEAAIIEYYNKLL